MNDFPRSQRWLIPDVIPDGGKKSDTENYWTSQHVEHEYSKVFSVGEDPAVWGSIVALLSNILKNEPSRILIAGCGSRVELQERIISATGSAVMVFATDFAKVVDVAARSFSHSRLKYFSLDDPRWDRENFFDVVISINVLVRNSDKENRKLLTTWCRNLKLNGRLLLLSPALFSGFEIATLTSRDDLAECLDLVHSRWTETHQEQVEIEYLPIRLRRALTEAGLVLEKMEILFLTGSSSRRQLYELYAIRDPDIDLYEYLTVAQKVTQ